MTETPLAVTPFLDKGDGVMPRSGIVSKACSRGGVVQSFGLRFVGGGLFTGVPFVGLWHPLSVSNLRRDTGGAIIA